MFSNILQSILTILVLYSLVSCETYNYANLVEYELACNETTNNYVLSLFWYPTDICFQPTGGVLSTNSSYLLSCNGSDVTVGLYNDFQCTDLVYEEHYQQDACNPDNVIASCYTEIPEDYFQGTTLQSELGPWQTILTVSYFSSMDCKDINWIDQSSSGFPQCAQGYFYYCTGSDIHFEMCLVSDCSSGCQVYYEPLASQCTPSNNTGDWSIFIYNTNSAAFLPRCEVAAPAPSPTPSAYATPSITPSAAPSATPSATPSTGASPSISPTANPSVVPTPSPSVSSSSTPSPSPSPSPSKYNYVNFLTYLEDWCDYSAGNYLWEVFWYPLHTCFESTGGNLPIDQWYILTYNESASIITAAFWDADHKCTGEPEGYQYYTDGSCSMFGVYSECYEEIPSDFYQDSYLVGQEGPWQTLVAIDYYSTRNCSGNSWIAQSANGFQQCNNGAFYYCSGYDLHYEICTATDCSAGCENARLPLMNQCTLTPYFGDWQPIIEQWNAASFKPYCQQVLPSPSASPSAIVSGGVMVIPSSLWMALMFVGFNIIGQF